MITQESSLISSRQSFEHQLPSGVISRLVAYGAVIALALTGAALEERGIATAQAETATPLALSSQANKLVVDTAETWATHQLPDGNLMDPSGKKVGGYGVSMLGQAMVETGLATGDQQLQDAGIRAELNEALHPSGGGFETFSLAGAYVWNEQNLASNPDWQAAKAQVANVLQNRTNLIVDPTAKQCYENPKCWNNLKLVGALAEIELGAALHAGQATVSSEAHKAVLTTEASTILQNAARQTGADARYQGGDMSFDQAGILSDPTRNPLAYHELSAMVLGRAIEAVGPSNVPPTVRAAFLRSARAIIGLMAPDGDVAYIGRGQGQVWNVAAAADALAIAAHNTPDPVWRGRFLAGAERALNRLGNVYKPGVWGLPLAPRLVESGNTDYSLGIDAYANSVEYNGLADWALSDAAHQLSQTSPAPQEHIGADADGVFIDPSHTKFVSVRKGNLWWAIHASDTHVDSRYDFGLVAAERQVDGQWKPALPYRPLTNVKTSGGPVLISHGNKLVPKGDTITTDAQGLVKIGGGWTAEPGGNKEVDSNTHWTFRPEPNGVIMAFQAKPNRTYQFQAWYPEGSQVLTNAHGISVTEPNGRHESYTLNNAPVQISSGPLYHSAYDKNLGSSTLTVHANAPQKIIYNTTF